MDVPSELLRAARVALGKSQRDLAELSGIGHRTIVRLELNDPTVSLNVRRTVQSTVEGLGVTFLPDDEQRGPGLRVHRSMLDDHGGRLRF